MQYIPKHFTKSEFAGPDLLKEIPDNIFWTIIDAELLKACDDIRDMFGVCYINTGKLAECGLRNFNSKTGAKFSAHKFGKAADIHIKSIEDKQLNNEMKVIAYNEVRKILSKLEKFKNINFENNVSWLHIDTFNRGNRFFNG